jgi:sugar/nucleoside kinase (ribokinase family)
LQENDILVVGSVAFDSIETPQGVAERVLGGSATYFSAAARFFGPVRLVAVVGGDFGPEHLEFFSERQIDTKGLRREQGKTFYWKGRYAEGFTSRTTLVTELNVFESFRPSLPEHYRETPVVFLANIHPELQLDVLKQVEAPKIVAMDTMDFWMGETLAKLKEVLRQARVVIINDEEALQLAESPSVPEAARRIREMGPDLVLIKKGEHGAFLRIADYSCSLPAYPTAAVVDPTGAGDTFAGGFLGALAVSGDFRLDNVRRAMACGTVLASFCVEGFGTERLAGVQRDELEERYREYREMLQVGDVPGT